MLNKNFIRLLGSCVLLGLLQGCATTETVAVTDSRDPWEGWNRDVQSFNDGLDDYAMKPIAEGYRWITPSFVDKGVTNFFSNLDDIGVTINDLLQFKLSQSGMDGARFLVNTVAGVAGLFDVASMIDLPKHKEDFDQTLGVWGVPSGPYIVLPFFGSTTPRGIGGLIGDAGMNPITYVGGSIVPMAMFAVNATDQRADNLSTEKIASEAAIDRYEFFRDSYLQQREYLITDGNVSEDDEAEFILSLDIDDEDIMDVGEKEDSAEVEETEAVKTKQEIVLPAAPITPY